MRLEFLRISEQSPTRFPQSQHGPSGGRRWWAHFEFTRINIEPIVLKNKVEERREARASRSIAG
jgi:hypothetical protein